MIIRLPWWFAAGTTINSWLMIVRKNTGNATIEHERVHQYQMLVNGWFRFVWRYLTNGGWRAMYECEAYAKTVLVRHRESGIGVSRLVSVYAKVIRTSKLYAWLPGEMPQDPEWYETRLWAEVTLLQARG